jgi:hypothetical protein
MCLFLCCNEHVSYMNFLSDCLALISNYTFINDKISPILFDFGFLHFGSIMKFSVVGGSKSEVRVFCCVVVGVRVVICK